jgi:hypothetical protein
LCVFHTPLYDQALYDEIVGMDSTFRAYNSCNMDAQAAIYADSLEFYHDKGGLMTSKQELLALRKKYLWQSNQRISKRK